MGDHMDAAPFLESLLDDEGLTADLPDGPARVLLDWLTAAVRADVTGAADRATAEAITRVWRERGRLLSRVAAGHASAAEAATKLGIGQRLAELPSGDPGERLKRLLSWQRRPG